MKRRSLQSGYSVLEVVIASSLFLAVVLSISSVTSYVTNNSQNNLMKIQATYLAEEGLEAMRELRDTSWSVYIGNATTSPFALNWNSTTTSWSATTTSSTINNSFSRYITISNVYRDGSQNIVATGTLDSSIKKITSTVYWNIRGATSTRSVSTYLSNLFLN